MASKTSPLVSVCIPVYETEVYLEQCLRSVITQDFESFEVVIVSDASRGKDGAGRNCKKIVHAAQKECKKLRRQNKLTPVDFTFIENRENRGIIEVRRTLVTASRGHYIAMLDSDDEFVSGALSAMYSASCNGKTDIVQGSSVAGVFDESGKLFVSEHNKYGNTLCGTLKGHEIFHRWVTEDGVTGILWAKLIKRSVFIHAFEHIHYTECNLAEDYMIFFFVSLLTDSYTGIKNHVYNYRLESGVSSGKAITSLEKWKKICSTASVFTVISLYLEENSEKNVITKEENLAIRRRAMFYLMNNIQQMKHSVSSELQAEAQEMLCEYWGKDFVEKMIASYEKGNEKMTLKKSL